MLNHDDMDVFNQQITNAAQTAKKNNVTSFVNQPNCQNADVL